MAYAQYNGIHIGGISTAVPTKVEKTADYVGPMTHESVDEFMGGTGVSERHVASKYQTTSDLCYVAARELMKQKCYTPADFDALIFVSQTPDYFQPATSHILHMRLGMPMDCVAFDVNLGCSGYVYGLNISCAFIQSSGYRRVLLLCGEVERPNPLIPVKDHILFGCSGAATIIEKGDTDVSILLRSDGHDYGALIVPGGNLRNPIIDTNKYFSATYPRMDGETVFSFSISKVPRAFKDFYDVFHCSPENFDYCVLHQANLMIMKTIARKVGFSWEKVPISLDRYGNTSSATIPLTVTDLCSKLDKGRELSIISSGFGIGMSWGVASFYVNTDDVLQMIETDEYFEEAYRVDC